MKTHHIGSMLLALLAFSTSAVHAVLIETVTVGNPGNGPDHDYHIEPIHQGTVDGGRGAVAYAYEIGKYEVTNAEYAEFLNAVAGEDTHALYRTSMSSVVRGGILRNGSSGNYTYTVKPNMGNKPVNYVSFWDAARFTNWLHNGQPIGAQDNSTTEDGAYTLGGVTNPDNLSIFRNVGANWFVPDENEWYKAAYYQPASQGGDSDSYWMFPTASNVQPIRATANTVGDISNPGANVANYLNFANWNGTADGNVTTAGSAGPMSESYYGTADQAGNVWEWYETIVLGSINIPDEDGRGVWGGSWANNPGNFRADHNIHHFTAPWERARIGFRVARYAQESSFAADFDLDDNVDGNDLTDPRLGWTARFGIDLDGSDFLSWQRQFGNSINASSSESVAVPEPSSGILLVGLAAIATLVRLRPKLEIGRFTEDQGILPDCRQRWSLAEPL